MTRVPRWLLWVVSVIVMAGTAVYQRRTGPTYPVSGTAEISGERIRFSLPRSYDGPDDAEVRIAASESITGSMEFRRFRSNDSWSYQPMMRESGTLVARIPHQPTAGKVLYRISLSKQEQQPVPLTPEHLIIRFRNSVPVYVYLPHIIMMFLALLLPAAPGSKTSPGDRGRSGSRSTRLSHSRSVGLSSGLLCRSLHSMHTGRAGPSGVILPTTRQLRHSYSGSLLSGA